MKKIGDVVLNGIGKFEITLDEKNIYRVHLKYVSLDPKHGWPCKHSKLLVKCDNVASCLRFITQCAEGKVTP